MREVRDKKKWIVVTPEGKLSQSRPEECLIPEDATERLIVAKRIVAERCIYGVDKNPLAVEMAKLSLWLETMQRDKPFTFLDHALKCGDSLVGVSLEQLYCWDLDTSLEKRQLGIGMDLMQREIDEAIAYRLQIEAKPVITQQDQKEKANLLKLANSRINDLRTRCDLLIQSYLAEGTKANKEALRQKLLLVAQGKKDVTETEKVILPDLEKLRPFHWELEFPEVFLNVRQISPKGHTKSDVRSEGFSRKEISPKGLTTNLTTSKGFDALVGNPPFMGGNKITGALGTPYRDYLVEWIANNKKGSADLCAYFFLRGQELINQKGGFGLVATNTIAQGDTREVGLDQLVAKGSILPRAVSSRKWEGTASLEVAYVWLRQGEWKRDFVLDEKPVSGITPYLTAPGKSVGNPCRLIANQDKSFKGSEVNGMGFVLTTEEAQLLIDKNPRNQDVLFPYLNGEDLNSNFDQSPSRWVINFFDWALDAEHDDRKKPKGHPYAADYPDCLKILEEKVKPEREKKATGNQTDRDVARRWWQFKRPTKELYEAIAGRDRVLVRARVSNTNSIAFVPKGLVMSEMLVVFNFNDSTSFVLLQSMAHTEWLTYHSSTLGAGTRYTPSDCFETFPFPDIENKEEIKKKLEQIGEKYYTHRQNIMQTRQEGLTKTYNRFHNPNENSENIQILRQLHVEMDYAVADAYEWKDINLDHNFHQTKQGLRYTISEEARREILDRLLQLNHQRYAEEVAMGLHDKKKKKAKIEGKKKSKITDNTAIQGELNL